MNVQEALHVHALLQHILRANQKCLLLLNTVSPRAKNQPLLAVEILLEVAASHDPDQVISPALLELLPILQSDHLRLRVFPFVLKLSL